VADRRAPGWPPWRSKTSGAKSAASSRAGARLRGRGQCAAAAPSCQRELAGQGGVVGVCACTGIVAAAAACRWWVPAAKQETCVRPQLQRTDPRALPQFACEAIATYISRAAEKAAAPANQRKRQRSRCSCAAAPFNGTSFLTARRPPSPCAGPARHGRAASPPPCPGSNTVAAAPPPPPLQKAVCCRRTCSPRSACKPHTCSCPPCRPTKQPSPRGLDGHGRWALIAAMAVANRPVGLLHLWPAAALARSGSALSAPPHRLDDIPWCKGVTGAKVLSGPSSGSDTRSGHRPDPSATDSASGCFCQ